MTEKNASKRVIRDGVIAAAVVVVDCVAVLSLRRFGVGPTERLETRKHK